VTNPYERELSNMAAAIAGTAEPLLGRDDAVAQARVIEALYGSAESGEAVRL
jgi:D-xylose 1-dehydrogenase (NADP+, D-xylono-1,5-lactone-forming)